MTAPEVTSSDLKQIRRPPRIGDAGTPQREQNPEVARPNAEIGREATKLGFGLQIDLFDRRGDAEGREIHVRTLAPPLVDEILQSALRVHPHPASLSSDRAANCTGRGRLSIAKIHASDPQWRRLYRRHRPICKEGGKGPNLGTGAIIAMKATDRDACRTMLRDFNDLQFFIAVVQNRGFSSGARALGVPKSRVSRRVALFEERPGVRLLDRGARGASLTEIGRQVFEHARAALVEAEAAEEAALRMQSEPRGLVRISCPLGLQSRLPGALSRVLLDWGGIDGILHLVFASRRGVLPGGGRRHRFPLPPG